MGLDEAAYSAAAPPLPHCRPILRSCSSLELLHMPPMKLLPAVDMVMVQGSGIIFCRQCGACNSVASCASCCIHCCCCCHGCAAKGTRRMYLMIASPVALVELQYGCCCWWNWGSLGVTAGSRAKQMHAQQSRTTGFKLSIIMQESQHSMQAVQRPWGLGLGLPSVLLFKLMLPASRPHLAQFCALLTHITLNI